MILGKWDHVQINFMINFLYITKSSQFELKFLQRKNIYTSFSRLMWLIDLTILSQKSKTAPIETYIQW